MIHSLPPVTGQAQASAKRVVTKQLHFHTTASGRHVTLRGLSEGKAKISVVRSGRVVGHKTVKIRNNKLQQIHIRLHKSRG